MGREIKFRAWDTVNKGWFEPVGDLFVTGDGALGYVFKAGAYGRPGFTYLTSGVYQLSQFTGLHDATDREIYEGDIVEYRTDVRAAPFTLRYVVLWKDSATGFSPFADYECGGPDDEHIVEPAFDADMVRVVGNIYENPDLLPKVEAQRA